jgi:hypothetical protein
MTHQVVLEVNKGLGFATLLLAIPQIESTLAFRRFVKCVLSADALAQAGHIAQVNQVTQFERVAIVFLQNFAVVLKIAIPMTVDLLNCAVSKL